jgi:hypothetical protein
MFGDDSEIMKSREDEINARVDAKIEADNSRGGKKKDPESGLTFGEAFKNAEGQKDFMWRGKKYARATKDEKSKDLSKMAAKASPNALLGDVMESIKSEKAAAKPSVKPLTVETKKFGNSGNPNANRSPLGEALRDMKDRGAARTAARSAELAANPPTNRRNSEESPLSKIVKSRFGCGGKVKMAEGGAVCRGGGAATRGVKFRGVK